MAKTQNVEILRDVIGDRAEVWSKGEVRKASEQTAAVLVMVEAAKFTDAAERRAGSK